MERILIFAPNWLGDAVMALPAIADVRRACPDAALTVAARPAVAPLFALVREVDETVVLASDRTSARSLAQPDSHGAAPRCDVALLLPNSFNAALLAFRSGTPERWGYRSDWRAPLLTRTVARPRGLHQAAYYQHLTAALGMAAGTLEPRIELTPAAVEEGARLLRDHGWDGRTPAVGLAPGAAYGAAKRWPPELFGTLARSLAADGMRGVLVGSAADAPTGREVEAAAGVPAPINLIGRTSLAELAGALRNCRALVSNDSGAMHLAAAVGVPVTALFGPTDDGATAPIPSVRLMTDDRRLTTDDPRLSTGDGGLRTGDRGLRTDDRRQTTDNRPPAAAILIHPVWCRPCMLRECPLDHACMHGISVAAVKTVVSQQLSVTSQVRE